MTNGQYGETKRIHNFQNDLIQSIKDSKSEFIDEAYYKAFPHLTGIEFVEDKNLQLKGVDKILKFGLKEVMIDEKIRTEVYPDILLEEWSNKERRIVGWLGRDKYTDYIAYIKLPIKLMYILPFTLLQLAWRINYLDWKKRYGIKEAKNKGYTTTNIPVPTAIVYKAMWDCSQILIEPPKEFKYFDSNNAEQLFLSI